MGKNYIESLTFAVKARHKRDFQTLGAEADAVYNHFVHFPQDYLLTEHRLPLGTLFASALPFKSQDEDVQEVKAENAVFFLYPCIDDEDDITRNMAISYLFFVFSGSYRYLWQRIGKLFGDPDFRIPMSSHVFFSLPENVRDHIQKCRFTPADIRVSVLLYLQNVMEDGMDCYLDLQEEKRECNQRLASINPNAIDANECREVGKYALKALFENIDKDIKSYISYKLQ